MGAGPWHRSGKGSRSWPSTILPGTLHSGCQPDSWDKGPHDARSVVPQIAGGRFGGAPRWLPAASVASPASMVVRTSAVDGPVPTPRVDDDTEASPDGSHPWRTAA